MYSYENFGGPIIFLRIFRKKVGKIGWKICWTKNQASGLRVQASCPSVRAKDFKAKEEMWRKKKFGEKS